MKEPSPSPGKQKSTCLSAWNEWHKQLWPDHKIPTLLQPLTLTTGVKRDQPRWFQEQTVPTTMMFSIFGFGLGAPKRNPKFRSLTAAALAHLTAKVCQHGGFRVVVTPVGQATSISWPVPLNTCLPLLCYIADPQARADFTERWGWESQARWLQN